MRDSVVPAAMVFAALGLMLAFVPRKIAAASMMAAIVLAFMASRLRLDETANDVAILLCCAAVSVLAVRTYWPSPLKQLDSLAISAIAGLVSGTTLAASVPPPSLWQPMLASLVVVPAMVAVERGYAIVPRVVASWLVAVAVLAALLPYVVAHPGYVPEHRS